MTNSVKTILEKNNRIVIGVIHLAPLFGYKEHPGFETVEEKFLEDFYALRDGGVDSVFIENNYDIPHYEKALPETIPMFKKLCERLRALTDLPLGISILWNDYENALSIAKELDFQFIRVPVFVDRVKTEYGVFEPQAENILEFRKKINAENILLFTDVQVKHAEHLIQRPLSDAVEEALAKKSDGIILTGKWTGTPPTAEDVIAVKDLCKKNNVPLFLGSGVTAENLGDYDVDGVIVASYFKEPQNRGAHRQNLYPWQVAFSIERVRGFMTKFRDKKRSS